MFFAGLIFSKNLQVTCKKPAKNLQPANKSAWNNIANDISIVKGMPNMIFNCESDMLRKYGKSFSLIYNAYDFH